MLWNPRDQYRVHDTANGQYPESKQSSVHPVTPNPISSSNCSRHSKQSVQILRLVCHFESFWFLTASCQTFDQTNPPPPPPQTRNTSLVGWPQPLSQYTPRYTPPQLTSRPVSLGICWDFNKTTDILNIFRSFHQELRAKEDTVPRLGHEWNRPQMPAGRTVLHTNVTGGLSRRGTTKNGERLTTSYWLRYLGIRLALLTKHYSSD
jgi:hypothetical protein